MYPPPVQKTLVAVLFPSGRLELNSTVKELATALSRLGYAVDLCTVRNHQCPEPHVDATAVQLHLMPWVQQQFQEPVLKVTLQFLFWASPALLRRRYGLYVAAGLRGLMVASTLALLSRIPVIYHCIELYPSWQQKGVTGLISKALERWANRRAAHTLVQDELRARILAEDNRIPRDRVGYFPVSPYGPACLRRSNYLRQKFGIPEGNKIILLAGGVWSPFTPSLEIVRTAQEWPQGWTLVLHTHSKLPASFLEELRRIDSKRRVVFSLDPVSSADLPGLVASADIGLALYAPHDDNLYYLGLASGKLAEYLCVGLPVVVSDLPGINERVERYRCGVCVGGVSECADAIRRILADYEGYSRRSLEMFDRELALENFLPSLRDALTRVLERKKHT